ncbi:hypothetical protein ACIA03_08490 [Nocardioides sp. NPDC051685]|uniref:hypothetical protein n=1 Tax=Nocardioides sp. NPDC051685 TaxID=3364334 RepID=UPI0037A8AEB2
MTTSRTLGIATLALTAAMALAGCGSDSPNPDGDPTNGTPTADASGSAGGSEVPADWQEAKTDEAAVHLPRDWAILNAKDTSVGFEPPKGKFGFAPGGGTMTTGVHSGTGDLKSDINRAAEHHLKALQSDPTSTNVKRLSNMTTADGVELSIVQWETDQTWNVEYTTVTEDGQWVLGVTWQFNKSDIDRKGSQELIAPVMETFELL